MAATESHITQWRHNRRFLATISPDYPDWLVTVSFYVALHAVDALLAFDKISATTHAERNAVIIRTNRYSHIKQGYMPLYNLSQVVRYLADPAQWIPYERFRKDVVIRYLYPIEKSVQHLIGHDLGLPKIELAGD